MSIPIDLYIQLTKAAVKQWRERPGHNGELHFSEVRWDSTVEMIGGKNGPQVGKIDFRSRQIIWNDH